MVTRNKNDTINLANEIPTFIHIKKKEEFLHKSRVNGNVKIDKKRGIDETQICQDFLFFISQFKCHDFISLSNQHHNM